MVAAGGVHTVLLRSDGTAAAFGDNDDGQCDLPALDGGLTYTQAAAGYVFPGGAPVPAGIRPAVAGIRPAVA